MVVNRLLVYSWADPKSFGYGPVWEPESPDDNFTDSWHSKLRMSHLLPMEVIMVRFAFLEIQKWSEYYADATFGHIATRTIPSQYLIRIATLLDENLNFDIYRTWRKGVTDEIFFLTGYPRRLLVSLSKCLQYQRLKSMYSTMARGDLSIEQEVRRDLDEFYRNWRPLIRNMLIRRYFAPEVVERLIRGQHVDFGEFILYNRYFERNKPFNWVWTDFVNEPNPIAITCQHPFKWPRVSTSDNSLSATRV